MRIRFSTHRNQCGSILAVTLILSIVLGLTLGSYLYWVSTQNLLVAASQNWNYALALAESGIEEGMAQINVKVGTVTPLDFTNSIKANWGPNGPGPWYKTNTVGRDSYSVIVSNDYPPTIYSSGTATLPLVGKQITRTVKVTTATNSLFGVGIAAIQGITMNGNNINVDAYDSADLVHFPGGLYNPTNAFAGGDVATENGVLAVKNANIHGRLLLSPNSTYSIKAPNGVVGDMPWNWPAQSGLESPDWVFNDWNKDFADVLVPFTSGLTPPTGTGTNSYVLGTGNYYVNGNFSASQNLLVNGVASIYVTGNFSANTITILPSSFLRVYVGNTSGPTSSTTFGTVNNGGNAYNLQLFGLPTMNSFTLSGNNTYMGTVYAPECDMTLNGTGNNTTVDYQGACVVRSFNSNGHFNLHYDKNLSRIGFPSGYTCSSWREL
jgi:type II secretory pathway pseudopilin PulG